MEVEKRKSEVEGKAGNVVFGGEEVRIISFSEVEIEFLRISKNKFKNSKNK